MKLVKRTRERDGKTIVFYASDEYEYYTEFGGNRPRREKRDRPFDCNVRIPRVFLDEKMGKWVFEFDSDDDMGNWDVARFRYYFDSLDDVLAVICSPKEEEL